MTLPNQKKTKKRIFYEVQNETNPVTEEILKIIQIKKLQEMRKMLADGEVALAKRKLYSAQENLEKANHSLQASIQKAHDDRVQWLAEKLVQTSSIKMLNLWRSAELKMMQEIQNQKEHVLSEEKRVAHADDCLDTQLKKRRMLEVRKEKYAQMIEILTAVE